MFLEKLGRGPIVEGNRFFQSEREVREDTSECAATQVKDALEQLASEHE